MYFPSPFIFAISNILCFALRPVNTSGRRQAGFSLLEAMLAVVILGFGVLGLAQLQVQAFKFNNDALWRSQASLLAYDLIERMRLNPDQAEAYRLTSYAQFNAQGDCRADAPTTANGIALNDLNCWQKRVAGRLPAGKARLIRGADGRFILTLCWTERPGSRPIDTHDAAAGVESEQSWVFLL